MTKTNYRPMTDVFKTPLPGTVPIVPIGYRYVPKTGNEAYREYVRESKRKTGTRWVKDLYHKRYDDPAYLYLAQRRLDKDRKARNKFLGLMFVVILCILHVVVK